MGKYLSRPTMIPHLLSTLGQIRYANKAKAITTGTEKAKQETSKIWTLLKKNEHLKLKADGLEKKQFTFTYHKLLLRTPPSLSMTKVQYVSEAKGSNKLSAKRLFIFPFRGSSCSDLPTLVSITSVACCHFYAWRF